MPTLQRSAPELAGVPIAPAPIPENHIRSFLRRAAAFIAIGMVLYTALYGASEWLVRENAVRNRFHAVHSAPLDRYDFVILGASHAAVFDYRDMNARLEQLTGATILNLATVGAGITVNRLLLDYFFESRDAGTVVYVLDSFAFYSREWNEARLGDTRLYLRAPLDPVLGRLLLGQPGARAAGFAYLTGFPKINNRERFAPDLFPGEGSAFERSYRPIPQLDRQRLQYLYPDSVSTEALLASPYLREFERLVEGIRSRGSRFIVIRPPIPERIYAAIPNEAEFDRIVRPIVEAHGGEYHDLALVDNDPSLFYDSDHLNMTGVIQFFENHLAEVLTGSAR